MAAHSTTKKVQDLETEYLFLIVSQNDHNIKKLLYFVWTEIVHHRTTRKIIIPLCVHVHDTMAYKCRNLPCIEWYM